MGEELVDLGRAHVFGMAGSEAAFFQVGVVEVEVFFDPANVGIAGAGGVVFEFDGLAILVEEFLVFWRIGLCHFVAFLWRWLYNRHIGNYTRKVCITP